MLNPVLQLLFTGKDRDEQEVIFFAYGAYLKQRFGPNYNVDKELQKLNEAVIIDWDLGKQTLLISKIPFKQRLDNREIDINSANSPLDAYEIPVEFIRLLKKADDNSLLFKEAFRKFVSIFGTKKE